MDMHSLGLFLPIIFAIHNYEEYRSFEEFKDFYFRKVDKKFHHRKVFLYALIILTLFAGTIAILNYFIKSQTIQSLTTIMCLALLINGLQHCGTSLWSKKILPGTLSSIVLLIPFSLLYFALLAQELHFSVSDFLIWILFAIILIFLSIRISLSIGYFLYLLSKKRN